MFYFRFFLDRCFFCVCCKISSKVRSFGCNIKNESEEILNIQKYYNINNIYCHPTTVTKDIIGLSPYLNIVLLYGIYVSHTIVIGPNQYMKYFMTIFIWLYFVIDIYPFLVRTQISFKEKGLEPSKKLIHLSKRQILRIKNQETLYFTNTFSCASISYTISCKIKTQAAFQYKL